MALAALLALLDGALAHDVARWLLFALAFVLVAMSLWLVERGR